ncbi:MAG: pyridoxamine 5'-phosphate oxidase family protein [Oscillospiraceae bacterium]|nr:pyridoxamine 5'-phosphate oxidase family protein [Oscillospiraceae bacterium]
MDMFEEKYEKFLSDVGESRIMVLSTSENDVVSSRMMSVVRIGDRFFFQTDILLRKYRQIKTNPHVALCADNIQIEGICEEMGHPLDDAGFRESFAKHFKGSFDAYTGLHNERLFVISPVYVQRWVYDHGVPYIESFDVAGKNYSFRKYESQ